MNSLTTFAAAALVLFAIGQAIAAKAAEPPQDLPGHVLQRQGVGSGCQSRPNDVDLVCGLPLLQTER